MIVAKEKTSRNCRRTRQTERIADAVRAGMPDALVDAYRYNAVEVRVRVISSKFRGKSVLGRHRIIRQHFDALAERDQQNIIVTFAFTPAEIEAGKLLNLEYERPTPPLRA